MNTEIGADLEQIIASDPKDFAKNITKKAKVALKALQSANKGKNAERVGISSKTLNRLNNL